MTDLPPPMEVTPHQTSNADNTWPGCNLVGNMFAIGCKNTVTTPARDFSHKLHAKLRSLTTNSHCDDEGQQLVNSSVECYSMWRDDESKPVVTAGPPISNGLPARHSLSSENNSSDLYFDFDLESPTSPVTEEKFINPFDNLEKVVHSEDCDDGDNQEESGCVLSSPVAESSDNDDYYDVPSTPPAISCSEHSSSDDNVNGCIEELTKLSLENENRESVDDVICDEGHDRESVHVNGENSCESVSVDRENVCESSPSVRVETCVTECCESSICSSKEDSPFSLHPPSDSDDIIIDEESCKPRMIRSSSLKSGKTPPGTPHRKKIVRFADALGLDLANIRTFLDEIPNIPKSAYEDLEAASLEQAAAAELQQQHRPSKTLIPLFSQPGGCADFLQRVQTQKVCLENAFMTQEMAIRGTVRVLNLDFYKSVYIRYTMDNWRSHIDSQATYIEGSCDGLSDKFSFIIYGNFLDVGQKLEFAVRFHCQGQQYWDSNRDNNYIFECLSTHSNPSLVQVPLPQRISFDDPWLGLGY